MTRGNFLKTLGIAAAGTALTTGAALAGEEEASGVPADAEGYSFAHPGPNFPYAPHVMMQYMRPEQLQQAGERMPVVYVPFGLIEWHGLHNPLGCDATKAHGILIRAAQRHGGVVYPPIYFHHGFSNDHLFPILEDLWRRLRGTGFRVLMGISGHNVQEQIDMINQTMAPMLADGKAAGHADWEYRLANSPEANSDHAAEWETSIMMYFFPDQVHLGALGEGELRLDMQPPDGIAGRDPRRYASAQKGRRSVELSADAIGRKARELLASLPPEERGFTGEIKPGSWWLV
jgi:creatinine amidohydrolase